MSTKTVAPGITRFDFENRKGYMVRIARLSKRVNEWFADNKHGGKRKALALAKARYDELLAEMGPVQSSTKNKMSDRNSSGHVGVHLAVGNDKRWPNHSYGAWVASWLHAEGGRGKINFSINKYGLRPAFIMACLARQELLTDREQIEALYEKRKKAGTLPKTKMLISKEAREKFTVNKAVTPKTTKPKSVAAKSVKKTAKKKTARKK